MVVVRVICAEEVKERKDGRRKKGSAAAPLDGDAAFRLEIVCGSIAHEKDQEGYIRLVFNKNGT
jgi:hypothetical protein